MLMRVGTGTSNTLLPSLYKSTKRHHPPWSFGPLPPQYRGFAEMVKLSYLVIQSLAEISVPNFFTALLEVYTWTISPEIRIRDPQGLATHLLDKPWDPTYSQVAFFAVVRTQKNTFTLSPDLGDRDSAYSILPLFER